MNIALDVFFSNIFLANDKDEGRCWRERNYNGDTDLFAVKKSIIDLTKSEYSMIIFVLIVMMMVCLMLMAMFYLWFDMVTMRDSRVSQHETEQK